LRQQLNVSPQLTLPTTASPLQKHGTCKGDKEYTAFAFVAEIDGFNSKRTSFEKNPCLQSLSLSLAPKL
jgi:hypothetical protein